MARIQILELPEGAGDDRPPFALVIDEVEDAEALGNLTRTRDLIGARAVLVFEGETIDIPANEVPVGPDGYPIRVRVEGDFEQFREQVQEEIAKAQAETADTLRRGLR